MPDKITGHLYVGINDCGEVVINHPDLQSDENGVGHIVFSANQARHLGKVLLSMADEIDGRRPDGDIAKEYINP